MQIRMEIYPLYESNIVAELSLWKFIFLPIVVSIHTGQTHDVDTVRRSKDAGHGTQDNNAEMKRKEQK